MLNTCALSLLYHKANSIKYNAPKVFIVNACYNDKEDFGYYVEDKIENTYHHNYEDELFNKLMLDRLNGQIDFLKEDRGFHHEATKLS